MTSVSTRIYLGNEVFWRLEAHERACGRMAYVLTLDGPSPNTQVMQVVGLSDDELVKLRDLLDRWESGDLPMTSWSSSDGEPPAIVSTFEDSAAGLVELGE